MKRKVFSALILVKVISVGMFNCAKKEPVVIKIE